MLGTLDFTGSGHWAPFDYSQSTALAVCACTHCTSAFMRNNYLKKKNIQTNTQKKKNKKTKKQHVHQQKNVTTVLAKNKNVIELSLKLAGQFQRTFKRRVS